MTVRNLYLVFYDVSDKKTLSKIRKLVSAYEISGQKSFAECLMTSPERAALLLELTGMANTETDRIHCFQLDVRQLEQMTGKPRRINATPFVVM